MPLAWLVGLMRMINDPACDVKKLALPRFPYMSMLDRLVESQARSFAMDLENSSYRAQRDPRTGNIKPGEVERVKQATGNEGGGKGGWAGTLHVEIKGKDTSTLLLTQNQLTNFLGLFLRRIRAASGSTSQSVPQKLSSAT